MKFTYLGLLAVYILFSVAPAQAGGFGSGTTVVNPGAVIIQGNDHILVDQGYNYGSQYYPNNAYYYDRKKTRCCRSTEHRGNHQKSVIDLSGNNNPTFDQKFQDMKRSRENVFNRKVFGTDEK